ncbi:type II toxin-antitoxin system CcdA family antitoxin [Pseudomonas syringae]|uniref:type II toxin-antitoxin system CcdA family antitoxin n=1 Tax=Pseudomonas syringae TaxID=317 RepID=UPI003D66346A
MRAKFRIARLEVRSTIARARKSVDLPCPPYTPPHASKQLVNLSINGDLLDRSKELGIDLSAASENALAEAVS